MAATPLPQLIQRIIKEKCPFCGIGEAFEKKSFFEVPENHSHCPHCGHDLQGEPGFYYGAMYVSYGLSVGLGIITFLICFLIFGIESSAWQIGIVIFVVLLFAKKNYLWSRLIWLAMFPPKKKKRNDS